MPNLLEAFGIVMLSVIGVLIASRFGLRRWEAGCAFTFIYGVIMIVVNLWTGISSIVSPSATSTPDMGPVRDSSSVLYNCYRWNKVNPSMNGMRVCVYGKVVFYSENPLTTDIYFSNQTSDFHLISTTKNFQGIQPGQCVQGTGQITSYYGALVIDIPHLYEITPTDACDKYP